MPPKKQWEDEEDSDESSTPSTSPPAGAAGRKKFDDEEGDDSDVLDSWDAAEDSEVEREKAKKAAAAKEKADAEAAANKKSKAQRIAEHQAERARALAEDSDEEEDEDEADLRERLRRTEKESDLKHAEDLFGDAGLSVGTGKGRKTTTIGSAVPIDPKDPGKTIDLSALPLLNPQTKLQFENMRNVLVPIVGGNYKKAHYTLFLQEFAKQLAKDLPSDQIKKISSALTALGNEKMKEEKAADKTGKKTKAQKTKTTLVASRNTHDTEAYEENFGDDDFM